MNVSAYYQVPWSAPDNIHAIVTTRLSGASNGPYASNNLATHVGDDPLSVSQNREVLAQSTGVCDWQWLQQVHGAEVKEATGQGELVCDGVFTDTTNRALAILTADCLPVLLTDTSGERVAAAHAGWRGLAAGVLANTVARFRCVPKALIAYVGPAIGQSAFEVDEPVIAAFRQSAAFSQVPWGKAIRPVPSKPGHWHMDLAGLARLQLYALGVHTVAGGGECTYENAAYYSYRREGTCGRFATVIWRT